jgi:hypothetical protein
VIHHPLGELLAGIIGHVLLEEPMQEVAAAGDRKADREGELVPEGAVIIDLFLLCSPILATHRSLVNRRVAAALTRPGSILATGEPSQSRASDERPSASR